MIRKNVIIIVLSIAFIISGSFNLYALISINFGVKRIDKTLPNSLIFGTTYGPQEIDPLCAIERVSQDVLMQIYEPLFMYNFSDPELPIIPLLAANFGIWSDNNYTIPLRQNISFHDGTKFNATSVKWNFDRLMYFINATGNLPIDISISPVRDLYFWDDNTPIINRTEIIDEWTIKFVLNKQYGPFLDILTLTSSSIVAPHLVPKYDYHDIEHATGFNVIGTGPWVFQYYVPVIETKFVRNDDYWRGPGAIETLIFSVIQDSDARNNALLAGDINFLQGLRPNYYDMIRDDPNLHLIGTELRYFNYFLTMNNKLINRTWRQAISWSIDYATMLSLLNDDGSIPIVVRSKSPLPCGMKYFNDSFKLPYFNITKARTILQAMGIGTSLDLLSDNAWRNAELFTLNFTYSLNNIFQRDMFPLLQDNLDLIGITVEDEGFVEIGCMCCDLPEWEKQMLYFQKVAPEYNDPSCVVHSLMSNISNYNTAHVNDTYLENLLKQGLEEIDSNIRKQIYNEIQRYVIEDLMPYVWCYQGINYYAMANYIHDFPCNMFGYTYFYPCRIN